MVNYHLRPSVDIEKEERDKHEENDVNEEGHEHEEGMSMKRAMSIDIASERLF